MARALRGLPSDLPRSDINVLGRIAAAAVEDSPCRPRDLADAEGLDPSTISRRIASLVDRGLVERGPDPADGRAHLLRLTDAGLEALRVEKRRRITFVTDQLGDWDEADLRDLARLLGQLSDSLEIAMARRR